TIVAVTRDAGPRFATFGPDSRSGTSIGSRTGWRGSTVGRGASRRRGSRPSSLWRALSTPAPTTASPRPFDAGGGADAHEAVPRASVSAHSHATARPSGIRLPLSAGRVVHHDQITEGPAGLCRSLVFVSRVSKRDGPPSSDTLPAGPGHRTSVQASAVRATGQASGSSEPYGRRRNVRASCSTIRSAVASSVS